MHEINEITGVFKSFGKLNQDKIFYLIRRNFPYGFFSNVRWIIRHLALIEGSNLIPVIDIPIKNTVYSTDHDKFLNIGFWDKYFYPINQYSLDEVYNSQNVIFANEKYPEGKFIDDKEKSIFLKYVKLNDEYEKLFSKFNFIEKKKTLGVHFRGTDMIYYPCHPTPIHPKQIFKHINKIIEDEAIEQIFFATDDKEYATIFFNYYQNKIKIITSNKNVCSYEMLSNKQVSIDDAALNVLQDVYCFSKCSILYGSSSNVIESGLMMSKKPIKWYYLNNGKNFRNPYKNKFRWYLARFIPLELLNFKNDLQVVYKN